LMQERTERGKLMVGEARNARKRKKRKTGEEAIEWHGTKQVASLGRLARAHNGKQVAQAHLRTTAALGQAVRMPACFGYEGWP
jgi:hypothetical protein